MSPVLATGVIHGAGAEKREHTVNELVRARDVQRSAVPRALETSLAEPLGGEVLQGGDRIATLSALLEGHEGELSDIRHLE